MHQSVKFLVELSTLLAKYDVELTSQDHWAGYPECGENIRITAEFKDYRVDDIDLGQCVCHDSIERGLFNAKRKKTMPEM
jgi:hypothetical protein